MCKHFLKFETSYQCGAADCRCRVCAKCSHVVQAKNSQSIEKSSDVAATTSAVGAATAVSVGYAAGSGSSAAAAAAATFLRPQPVSKHLDAKQMSTWDVVNVGQWLASIGPPFQAYAASFGANYLHGQAVLELTDDLLVELGVVSKIHRLRLLTDIRIGRQPSSSNLRTAAASANVASVTNGVDTKQQLDQLREENDKLREERLCAICLTKDRNIRFDPCGHACCCDECESQVKNCPTCRQLITDRHHVYL